jgi:hypothetical protein
MDSADIQAVIVWAALAAAIACIFIRLWGSEEKQPEIEGEIAGSAPAEEAGWADSSPV